MVTVVVVHVLARRCKGRPEYPIIGVLITTIIRLRIISAARGLRADSWILLPSQNAARIPGWGRMPESVEHMRYGVLLAGNEYPNHQLALHEGVRY